MSNQHVQSTCPINMCYQHVLSTCPINMSDQHVQSTCTINMSNQHVQSTCPINMSNQHVLSTCAINMSNTKRIACINFQESDAFKSNILINNSILCKIILTLRNNFTNDEHVFLRILVINLRVLCFEICAIPTMCTPYYQSRLNLVSEICLVNIVTFFFGMRCHCYILVEIIYLQF